MIMPAKMFSAMGVWTSLEPQLTTPVCTENSDSHVVVMQSAEERL
jgi:hypothetical protein